MMSVSAPDSINRRAIRLIDDNLWLLPMGLVTLSLVAWEIGSRQGWLPEYVLAVSVIVNQIFELLADGTLTPLLKESLWRALSGFVIGATFGFIAGLITGVSRWAGAFLDGPVAATYPIPKVALFPAIAVIWGFNDTTRIIVISLACFYPAYINAQAGTLGIDRSLLWFAKNTEASWPRRFVGVVVPAALPRAFVGLRLSLALSFVMMFATEIIGTGTGIGSTIFKARLEGDYNVMWAGVVIIGLIGFLADGIIVAIGSHFTRGITMETYRG